MLEVVNYIFLMLAIATCIGSGFGAISSDNRDHKSVYVICCIINACFTVIIWRTTV